MSKVVKVIFYLMIVIIIFKIFGMGRELVLLLIYGIGLYIESYLIVMNILNIIFVVIGIVIVIIFILMY